MSYSEVLGRPSDLHLGPLLDESLEKREMKLVSGRHLSNLHDASTYARKEIDQLLDIPVPDAVFKRGYLFEKKDFNEYDEYCERFIQLIRNDPERLRSLLGDNYWADMTRGGTISPSSSHLRDAFQNIAVRRLKVYIVNRLRELDTDQIMTIQTPLESPLRYEEKTMSTDQDFDCALKTFAMNVATLMETDGTTCSLFDGASLRKTAEVYDPHGAHDLPWLLGSLATNLAAEELHHDIRVRTFVGADLGEIEERYIKPVRQRSKAARFILNTMLTSNLQGANHFVIVTDANEDRIYVTDPKHGELAMLPEVFWERWVATNLQASLVVAVPR